MLIFYILYNACWNASHPKRNSGRYCHRCTEVFKHSPLDSRQIWMKFEFPRKFFEKYSTTKFYENPSSGNRVVPCGQKDRHDKANSAKLRKKAVEEKEHNVQDFNNVGWRTLMLNMRFMLDALTDIERCPINVELGYLVQVHISRTG